MAKAAATPAQKGGCWTTSPALPNHVDPRRRPLPTNFSMTTSSPDRSPFTVTPRSGGLIAWCSGRSRPSRAEVDSRLQPGVVAVDEERPAGQGYDGLELATTSAWGTAGHRGSVRFTTGARPCCSCSSPPPWSTFFAGHDRPGRVAGAGMLAFAKGRPEYGCGRLRHPTPRCGSACCPCPSTPSSPRGCGPPRPCSPRGCLRRPACPVRRCRRRGPR